MFHKTAIKGVAAENDILQFLEEYIDKYHIGDVVSLIGTSKGLLKNNKTDDIMAYVGGENSVSKWPLSASLTRVSSWGMWIHPISHRTNMTRRVANCWRRWWTEMPMQA